MKNAHFEQHDLLIRARKPSSIFHEIQEITAQQYPPNFLKNFKKIFSRIEGLFKGKFRGYRACNTEYHNFEHTLDVLLTLARLIDGYNYAEETVLSPEITIRALTAALFHDTGFIQEAGDTEGTGAKYSRVHVTRGVELLKKEYKKFSVPLTDVDSIGRIIMATEYTRNFNQLPFNSDEEKSAGALLGTADLLGQMSSRVYLEKLLFLYHEFSEAGIPGFETEFDIIRKTADFYSLTRKRFDKDFFSYYKYARVYFKERHSIDKNLYINAIEKNMNYLDQIIEDDSTNFRVKLKRSV